MLKPKKIKWRYRSKMNLKEDRDFVLQCIKYGYGVLKFPKLGIASPEIGSNKGGLQNEYKLKQDEYSSKKMVLRPINKPLTLVLLVLMWQTILLMRQCLKRPL